MNPWQDFSKKFDPPEIREKLSPSFFFASNGRDERRAGFLERTNLLKDMVFIHSPESVDSNF